MTKKAGASFLIEKNIPLPALGGRQSAYVSKYPFERMKVGDSFAIQEKVDINKVRYAATAWRMRHGLELRYAFRMTIRGDRSTFRCWRVA